MSNQKRCLEALKCQQQRIRRSMKPLEKSFFARKQDEEKYQTHPTKGFRRRKKETEKLENQKQ